ncbi:MAG TPA: site-specific DNA-methyltransferase [Phycisphaerae bacterium]|nr:site-specific DNA-methyltransferase [Phycisphaerae bacterium]
MVDRLGPFVLGPNDTPENGIYTGDARELAKAIPNESVDLIFTDPPYVKKYLTLYGWLAQMASRTLLPGGSLFAECGHAYLPEILDLIRPHLNYHWINCQYQPTVTATPRFWPRMIYIRWKPFLWFVKGRYVNRFFVQDGISSRAKDKRYHIWGQPETSVSYWLRQLAGRLEGAIVVDPFAGGGTVPAVCKMLGRRYLAFEIDPDVAETARERVRNTQMPLFVLEHEQVEMTLGGD